MSETLAKKIGKGIQLFRIHGAESLFDELADLGPLYEEYIERRRVWKLKGSECYFALLSIPYKDIEEILVRVDSPSWDAWNWKQLVAIAGECRWRGPSLPQVLD